MLKLPTVSLICAMTPNRVIGLEGGMPWNLPRDMKRFRRLTEKCAVVMGPSTFASLGSKPLRGRLNIVLTGKRDWVHEGIIVAHSVEEVLILAYENKYCDLFAIGGTKIYESFLPKAERLFITYVWSEVAGDRHFPEYDTGRWRQVFMERKWRKEGTDDFPTRFAEYEISNRE